MKFIFILIFFSLLFCACLPLPSSQSNKDDTNQPEKIFQTGDSVYEDSIRTIMLYPYSEADPIMSSVQPPVKYISSSQAMVLEFDDLTTQFQTYRAKIFHCDRNWKLSTLNDIEFLNEFNDFAINDYQVSSSTKIPYIHYRFTLPRLKISGNYILMVYRNNDEKDYVLTRRFVIVEQKMAIQPKVMFSSSNADREKKQQIHFNVLYGSYPVTNPLEEIKVVIRQNYQWLGAIDQLKPLYVREFDKKLEYTHFNNENNFNGLNEFRRFDIRSTRFLGFNVSNVDVKEKIGMVQLAIDRPRDKSPYFLLQDWNGAFIIQHYETGRGSVESDYVLVNFTLKTDAMLNKEVYVTGAFNNWRLDKENLMQYDLDNKVYRAAILLKQGEYNYLYAVKDPGTALPDASLLEGSFQATENQYEIFVYHRPVGSRADLVVAYTSFKSTETR